ncbi:Hsp20/alpha crystallin family protein [Metabacillus litoralis]|uniref:Hsp20/alpha crystallin family protein n=1 Tax=Metabacillus TaxID=2675233 RepID=UPI0013CEAF33|nr:Hsp20/alpha crystallin family protein [Metabacillus litoralis]MCM3164984.1 Hsp20/alpha crystallin family protein [Metabacillus litoralis]MCM3413570.1 Hsp20/alpha crystallin family protein [Metabacillus litoralis]UHA60563.1 Hsp20/alpha crystallin family protein [Metabacillus litoralis]
MYYEGNKKPYGMRRNSRIKNNSQKEIRSPRVDLFETSDGYYIRLSLPGVKKENLQVSFSEHDDLEIKGKVVTVVPENNKNIILQEIYQGPFHRRIKIPKKVNKKNVNFTYNNGILEVYLTF